MTTKIDDILISKIRALSEPLMPIPTNLQPRLKPLKNMRAVLFDVYGTLFVSGSGDIGTAEDTKKPDALMKALVNNGFEIMDKNAEIGLDLFLQYIAESHNKKRKEGIEYPEVNILGIWYKVINKLQTEHCISNPCASELDMKNIIQQVAVEYECRTNPVWPMPGAKEALYYLSRHNKALGIVSNAQSFTPLLFDALFNQSLSQFGFDERLCVWSWQNQHGKPSIKLHEEAAYSLENFYGIPSEYTLYVGNDMLNDIFTAHDSGFKTALFAGDKRSLRLRKDDSGCREISPDLIITDLRQLQTVI